MKAKLKVNEYYCAARRSVSEDKHVPVGCYLVKYSHYQYR